MVVGAAGQIAEVDRLTHRVLDVPRLLTLILMPRSEDPFDEDPRAEVAALLHVATKISRTELLAE